LIYHASLVGQGSAKQKGKISRMLAAKAALATRYDALGEEVTTEMGIENRAKLEKRVRALEEGQLTRISGTSKGSAQKKYSVKSEDKSSYNTAADSTIGKKRKVEDPSEKVEEETKKVKSEAETEDTTTDEAEELSKKEKTKKKKKRASEAAEQVETEESATEAVNDLSLAESPEKKKKKKKRASEAAEQVETGESATEAVNDLSLAESPEKKKKKKKKQKEEAEE